MTDYVLAQMNIARMRGATTDPVMEGFMARRDAINASAETAPGFIWRMTDEGDTSTSFGLYDDAFVIVNVTVWESIDALFQFTYYTLNHADAYRQRAEWFSKMDMPTVVLWWIKRGTTPTPSECKARLDYLIANGPSPYAFNFKQRFPAPNAETDTQSV